MSKKVLGWIVCVGSLTVGACKSSSGGSAAVKADDATPSATGAPVGAEDLCIQAQAQISGFALSDLKPQVDAQSYVNTDLDAFLKSKPSIDQKLHLTYMVPTTDQAQSNYPQVWCKLKNTMDVQQVPGLQNAPHAEAQDCNDVQKTLFDQAMANDADLKALYASSGRTFDYSNDKKLTGSSWSTSLAEIKLGDDQKIAIKTSSLESLSAKDPKLVLVPSLILNAIKPILGANYCKLVDPAALKQLLSDIKTGTFQK